MGTGERHLHLLHPFLYPLDPNQEHLSTGAPAHGEGNAKGFIPSAESYPKNEESRTAPATSLEGKSRFAGAELWVVFLQTGSQSKWGIPMCLITEPTQTGFRCLPAKLSPADNKVPRALGEAPAHQESSPGQFSTRSLVIPFVICLFWDWSTTFQPVVHRLLGACGLVRRSL